MPAIYRIDMSRLSVAVEEASPRYRGLGGRALTSAIVADEVPPECHPLSADNKLVIAPGMLTGTGAPCAGRLSIGAKSPLTGGIKEANSGGMAALALAALDVQAIVLEGQPPDTGLYRLVVTSSGVRIERADEFKRAGNYQTVESHREKFGDKVACISIGPAGEMFASAASVAVTDMEGRPTRHCGRGGMGAVMGSKGIKVIVVDPTGGQRVKAAEPDAFRVAMRKFNESLMKHPLTSETLPAYGTNILANVLNEAGGYPTRNFREGTFEGVESISGERQREIILARDGEVAHACHRGCTIKCSRIYVDAEGNYVTKGPEYETVWSHGADCGIDDLDAIAQMDRLEDDLGLDTIETGATIAVAMEAGILPFGDAAGALRLLEEVRQGSPLGRLIAAGAATLGKVYGVVRVPTVKGQSIPAYDPRVVKGIGVTYATSTMGADHTAGYAVAANLLKVGGSVDPLKPEGQVALSRDLQIATAAIDASGLCLFVAFAVLDDKHALEGICEMLAAQTGRPFETDDFLSLGRRVLSDERRFNKQAGFTAADDRLPQYFRTEKLAPHNATFDVPDEELDTVFGFAD